MKKFFNKFSVLALGCVMAMMATACHTGGDDGDSTSKVTPAVKNTLRGTIVDQDGAALMGATIKLNGKSVVVNGNTFEATGLKNGNYVVQVTATGYKKAEETVTLSTSTKVVEGETVVVGQDVTTVIYLTKDEKRTVNFGVGGDSESIVLETSKQNDGTGHIVGNTQDPNNQSLNSEIVVTATVPAMSSSEVKTFEDLLPAGMKIDDFYFNLTNLGSLDEATTTRSVVVAGDALPGNFTFFTGMSLIPIVPIDFSALAPAFTINIAIALPGDVKNVIKLYRNTGSGWNEITSSTKGNGISSVDFSASNMIVVKLSKLETMSFALGVQIDQSNPTTSMETFVSGPRVNSGVSPIVVKDLSYYVKTPGLVLTNLTQGAMVDYLRKIVLRYYSLQIIDEAKDVTLYYDFTTNGTGGYSLPANGQLFLAGFQEVTSSVYSVVNGTSSFRADEYGDVAVYPYAIIPTPVHGGGSND